MAVAVLAGLPTGSVEINASTTCGFDYLLEVRLRSVSSTALRLACCIRLIRMISIT